MPRQHGFAPLFIFIGVIILAAVGGAAYYAGKLSTSSQPLVKAPIAQVSQVVQATGTPTQFPLTPTPYYPGSTEYVSAKMKIAFNYLPNTDGMKVSVKELGSKIYVYQGTVKAEDGQWVEVFTKNPEDSLEQAIQKKLLAGIPASKCFVIKSPGTYKHYPATYSVAEISYPKNSDPDAFPGNIPSPCPKSYSQTNGMRFFVADQNHPGIFLYFDIGQYGIPAGKDINWQDTIRFVDAVSSPTVSAKTPKQVIEQTYAWYDQNPGSPIGSKAYLDWTTLSASFKTKVKNLVDTFSSGGYDPIICAQNTPEKYTIEDPQINGLKATTNLTQYFGSQMNSIKIDLVKQSGTWLIDNITCPTP